MSDGLTFSGLETFMNCERRFYFDYIENRPRPPSRIFTEGHMLHAGLAHVIRGQSVVEAAKNAVAEIEAQPDYVAPTPDYVSHLARNLEKFRTQVFPHLTWDVATLETPCVGTPLRGRADVICDTTPVVDRYGKITSITPERCVVDFKLKQNPAKRRGLDAAYRSGQLALYSLGAGISNGAFVEFYGNSDYDPRVCVANFSPDQLARWKRYFVEQRAAMIARGRGKEAYRLAERTSPLCSLDWCPHYLTCPGGLGYNE